MMTKIYSLNYCFIIYLAIILATVTAACLPVAPVEVTRVSQVTVEAETSTPITEEVNLTPTLTVVELIETPTLIPSPTPVPLPTNTVPPLPTIPSLQKVTELPITGSQYGTRLAITSDGTLLAVSSSLEDAIYIFDMFNQTVRLRLVEDNPNGRSGFSPLAFSPDGRYLAAWDSEFVMLVWNLENGEEVYHIRYDRDMEVNVRSISFSPDSQLLALSSFRLVEIYSVITGEKVDDFPSPNIVTYPPTDGGDHFLKPGHYVGQFWEVDFVPNHTNLLALDILPDPFVEGEGVSGGVYFWDMEAQSLANIIPGEGSFATLASSDGQLLLSLVDDQLIGWDIIEGQEIFRTENIESDEYPISITDAGFFATLSSSAGLKIWDFNGELVAELQSEKTISDAVLTPDGRLLIAYKGDDNPPIEVWEIHK